MRKAVFLTLALFSITSLAGCTWHDTRDDSPIQLTQPEVDAYEQREEVNAYESEVLDAALSYKHLYENMDKGTAYNVVLSDQCIAEIVEYLATYDYTVTSHLQDMKNHQLFEDFLLNAAKGQEGSAYYYRVISSGGLSRYDYHFKDNRLYLTSQTVEWDDEMNPYVKFYGNEYSIDGWEYTEKGFLIYEASSNPKRCTLLRVKPLGNEMRELCDKYITPIGYVGNNLFLTDWNQSSLAEVEFNDLYEALLHIETGEWVEFDMFTERVTAEKFEPLFEKYFGITPEFLQENALYYEEENAYFWNYLTSTKHIILYPAPVPEVVDWCENEDGTITMIVDALDDYDGVDRAFTHEVTVRTHSDGSFQYISNHIWPEDADSIPSYTPRSVQIDPFSQSETTTD